MAEPRPLRIAGFPRLAASYGLNELGDSFAVVALAILVFDQTHSAVATAALFAASKFVPAFVAPWLTARLDRLAVRVALPALYAIEALAFAGLAIIAAGRFSLALVLGLAFVDGALALTGRGLSRAAVAAVLAPRDLLRAGNAILNVVFSVMTLAGPALAGLVTGAAGASTALWIDAASFALIAVLLGSSRDLPPARVEPDESWIERVRAGLRYVRGNDLLRTLVTAEAVAFIFFFLVVPIEVVYVKRTLHQGDEAFGLLLASWGAGILVGSAIYARVHSTPTRLLVGGSTLLVGLGYLGLAASPTIVLACVASVLGGTGNGIQWVAVLTAVQEAVAEDFQARVVGLLESIGAAAPGVGYLLGGALTSVWSPRVAYLVAGVGVVLVAAAMTRRLRSA